MRDDWKLHTRPKELTLTERKRREIAEERDSAHEVLLLSKQELDMQNARMCVSNMITSTQPFHMRHTMASCKHDDSSYFAQAKSKRDTKRAKRAVERAQGVSAAERHVPGETVQLDVGQVTLVLRLTEVFHDRLHPTH
jgi:hypothetical protein